MFSISKKLIQVTKSALDEQLLSFTKVVEAAFDSGAGVVDMNVDAIKTSMAAAVVATNQFLGVKNSHDLMSLATAQSQQAFDHMSAYGRQVVEIASGVQARLSALAQSGALAWDKKAAGPVGIVEKDTDRIIASKLTPKKALDGVHEGYDNPELAGKKAKAGSTGNGATRSRVQTKDGQA